MKAMAAKVMAETATKTLSCLHRIMKDPCPPGKLHLAISANRLRYRPETL